MIAQSVVTVFDGGVMGVTGWGGLPNNHPSPPTRHNPSHQTSLLAPPPSTDQEIMNKIQDFVAYYGEMYEKNPERVLSLICAKLEDHPYPPDLVVECTQRFRDQRLP